MWIEENEAEQGAAVEPLWAAEVASPSTPAFAQSGR
jgi:hypothetical protein